MRHLLFIAALLLPACQSDAPPPSPPPAAHSASAGAVDLTPRRTRAGHLRIANQSVHDNPAAAALLLRRFDVEPSVELRAAIAEALPRTGGDWASGALDRLAAEPSDKVRKALVAALMRAEPAMAARAVAAGLADEHADVRFEAALGSGSMPRAHGRDFSAALQRALHDEDARVRAGAARSLGILGLGDAFAAVAALLPAQDAEVRLQALRALRRIDPAAAARLPQLEALVADRDPRVARTARTLSE